MKVLKIQGLLVILISGVWYIQSSLAQSTPVTNSPASSPTVQPITQPQSITAPQQQNNSAPEANPVTKPLQEQTSSTSSLFEPNWGYTGNNAPSNWGNLSAEFATCGIGTSQSPINININDALPSAQNRLQINYTSAPLQIVRDGSSTYDIQGKSLTINDGQSIQLNFPASNSKETITFNGETYRLVQFHFHTPGEHQLNGREFPASINLVHQGPNGKLAVIAVFVKPGEKNPVLERILVNLPKEKNKVIDIKDVAVNPAEILPTNKSYFTYLGSLTIPPCTEGVEWIVMEHPIEAAPSQLQQLRHAIDEDNARPVQPLHGRRILHITQ